MPAPNVLDVANQLQTVFRLILGAPNYTHTLASANVQKIARMWDVVPNDAASRPFIGIQVLGGQEEYGLARQIDEYMDVLLVCHLPLVAGDANPDQHDEDALVTSQLELLDDIFTAIDLGPGGTTLNRNAVKTDVTQWKLDAGDQLAVGTMLVNLRIKTRRTVGAS